VDVDECAEKTDSVKEKLELRDKNKAKERVEDYENTNTTKVNNTTCAERKVAADRGCAQGVSRCDLERRLYLHHQEQEAVQDGQVVVGLGLKERRGVSPLLRHQHVRDRHKDTHTNRDREKDREKGPLLFYRKPCSLKDIYCQP
jgi:hypothetical protein